METTKIYIKIFFLLIVLNSASCISPSKDRISVENKSVETILGIYWDASLNGNTEIIKTITTTRPDDFFEDCKSKVGDSIYLANDLKNKENDLTTMTSYIYASHIKFTRIKIIEKKIFEDESILTVLQADYSGNFKKAVKFYFYFKRFNNVWKIVSYLDEDFIDRWGNPKYGTQRPFCK